MQNLRYISPIVRAIGVIGAVAILVTSITYAALQSQATLTNNTIASATAELQVNNTDDGTSGPGSTDVGFAFDGAVPGGAASSVGNFELTNNGTADLTVAVQVPTLPTWTVDPSGAVDDTKVTVTISCTDADETFGVSDTLANMNATAVDLVTGTIAATDTAVCTAEVTMDVDAFTGSGATSTGFDLEFTGSGA